MLQALSIATDSDIACCYDESEKSGHAAFVGCNKKFSQIRLFLLLISVVKFLNCFALFTLK